MLWKHKMLPTGRHCRPQCKWCLVYHKKRSSGGQMQDSFMATTKSQMTWYEGLQIVTADCGPRLPTFFLMHRLVGLLASLSSNLTDRSLLSFKLFVSTAACRHRAAWSQQSRMSAVDCMHMQCSCAACAQALSHWYMEGNSVQLAVQDSQQHESGCHLRSICSMVWLSAGCQISLQPAVRMVPESVLTGGDLSLY